jgi:hypothetical protein
VGGRFEVAGGLPAAPIANGSGCKSSNIGSGVTNGGTSTGTLGAIVAPTTVGSAATAA